MASKKFGSQIRAHTWEMLNLALGQDKSIVTTPENLDKTEGKTEEYLDSIGLSRNELKRLERCGFAARGYTKNNWGPGERLPNGKIVKEGEHYRGNGRRVKWILIAKQPV